MRDQLRRVTAPTGGQLAQFDYDFSRRRLSKRVGLTTTTYVYDGDRIVNEYSSPITLTSRYEYGSDLIRANIGTEGPRDYFYDGTGSVTSLSGVTAPVSYRYDAWGAATQTGASANPIGYTGQFLDNETGLMALGNGERYYAPGLGRFVQQDSFAGMPDLPVSLNRYGYANGNPNKYHDPSGHLGILASGAAGALVGGAFGSIVDAAHQGVDIWNGDQKGGFDWGRSGEAAVSGAVWGAVIGSGGALAGVLGIGAAAATGTLIGGVGVGAASVAINVHDGRYGHAAVDAIATFAPFASKGVRGATTESFRGFYRDGYSGWKPGKGSATPQTIVEDSVTPGNGQKLLGDGGRGEQKLLGPAPPEVVAEYEQAQGRGRANPIDEQGPFVGTEDGGLQSTQNPRGNLNTVGDQGGFSLPQSSGGSGKSLLHSQFSRDALAYIRAIEKHTGFRLHRKQRGELISNLKSTQYSRLDSQGGKAHRRGFTSRVKNDQVKRWEKESGQVWPRYASDLANADGVILRKKGDPYDAHHVIENIYGGPHKWWNLTPARFPDEHQGGIHQEQIMDTIFP